MTGYLELMQRAEASAKEATKAKKALEVGQPPAPVVDVNTARAPRDEDDRRLLAAGWSPKERCGPLRLTIWANPETGFYCSQEVALHRLNERSEA